MVVKTPIHPQTKTALIPVLYTHPNGVTQTYWVSLKRFMEERMRGTPIQRIPREKHVDITTPEQEAPVYQMEFIENMIDFGVAGLEIGKDKYEVELISKLEVKKNGKLINTFPIKVDRKKVARAVLKRLL